MRTKDGELILTMNTPSENAIVFVVIVIILCLIGYIGYKLRDEIKNKITERFTSTIFDDYKPDVLVYYINLDRREDRNKKLITELQKSKIIEPLYKRFSAIDGKDIILQEYTKFNKSYEELNKKRGWIGCAESHRELWKKCINENKNMLIFEDDVLLKDNYDYNLQKSLKNLPDNFDIIYYNTVNYAVHIPYNSLYSRLVNKNFTTTNYLISPKGANKILKYTTPYNPQKQIDTYIVEMTREKILDAYLFKLPTIYTIQDFSDSDVQGKENKIRTHDIHKVL